MKRMRLLPVNGFMELFLVPAVEWPRDVQHIHIVQRIVFTIIQVVYSRRADLRLATLQPTFQVVLITHLPIHTTIVFNRPGNSGTLGKK